MSKKPTTPIPNWADAVNAEKLAPTDAKRAIGWEGVTVNNVKYGEQPSYLLFNYMMFSYGEWINYLNTSFSELSAISSATSNKYCVGYIDYGTIKEFNFQKVPSSSTTTRQVHELQNGSFTYFSKGTAAFTYNPVNGKIQINRDGFLIIQKSILDGAPDFATWSTNAVLPIDVPPIFRLRAGLSISQSRGEKIFNPFIYTQQDVSLFDMKSNANFMLKCNYQSSSSFPQINNIRIPFQFTGQSSFALPVAEGQVLSVNLVVDYGYFLFGGYSVSRYTISKFNISSLTGLKIVISHVNS